MTFEMEHGGGPRYVEQLGGGGALALDAAHDPRYPSHPFGDRLGLGGEGDLALLFVLGPARSEGQEVARSEGARPFDAPAHHRCGGCIRGRAVLREKAAVFQREAGEGHGDELGAGAQIDDLVASGDRLQRRGESLRERGQAAEQLRLRAVRLLL